MDTDTQTCDGKTLAGLLNLTLRHITRLADQGVIRKAKRGEYLLWPSVTAYVSFLQQTPAAKRRTVPPDGEEVEPVDSVSRWEKHRARLYKEKADRAERENKILTGELHEAKAVSTYLGPMIANFRARVLALPNDIAPLIPVECRAEIREQVDECVRHACDELSDYDPAKIASNATLPESDEIEEEDEIEEAEGS